MVDPFTIDLTRTAYVHLEVMRRYDRNAILDAIETQLVHTPEEEKR